MPIWLFSAILAQAVSALTVFIDKYVLVSKTGIRHPAAFAFYTAMLSGGVLILVPFGLVSIPSYEILFLSTLSAIFYITSLLFLYRTLQALSATNVIPLTAAAGALTSGVLAAIFLTHDLSPSLIPAFLFLTAGTFFIYCFCFSASYFVMALTSGILIGASTFIVKLIFESATGFGNALFWPLIMNVVVALIILAPARFKAIRMTLTESSTSAKWLALLSKVLGGFAFLLTFIAIAFGSVTIVNALGGLQLVFLLVFVPIFAHRIPDVFKYELTRETLILKIVGTICIVVGLAMLFLFQQ